MRQHEGANSLVQMVGIRSHGLDLGGPVAKVLDRTHAEKVVSLPCREETDLGDLQAAEIQHVAGAWRRSRMHACDVQPQKGLDPNIFKVTLLDKHARTAFLYAQRL
jgi:hypothetical protein